MARIMNQVRDGSMTLDAAKNLFSTMPTAPVPSTSMAKDDVEQLRQLHGTLTTTQAAILQKVQTLASNADAFFDELFPAFVQGVQLDVMQASNAVKTNFVFARDLDYAAFWQTDMMYPPKLQSNLETSVLKVIQRHIIYALAMYKEQSLAQIAADFDHVAGPSHDLIAHNLGAALKSCWNRQINDHLGALEEAITGDKFKDVHRDIVRIESERRAIFSPSFYKLLQSLNLI